MVRGISCWLVVVATTRTMLAELLSLARFYILFDFPYCIDSSVISCTFIYCFYFESYPFMDHMDPLVVAQSLVCSNIRVRRDWTLLETKSES